MPSNSDNDDTARAQQQQQQQQRVDPRQRSDQRLRRPSSHAQPAAHSRGGAKKGDSTSTDGRSTVKHHAWLLSPTTLLECCHSSHGRLVWRRPVFLLTLLLLLLLGVPLARQITSVPLTHEAALPPRAGNSPPAHGVQAAQNRTGRTPSPSEGPSTTPTFSAQPSPPTHGTQGLHMSDASAGPSSRPRDTTWSTTDIGTAGGRSTLSTVSRDSLPIVTAPTSTATPAKAQRPFRAPPLPASWVEGGGSVRIGHAFTVLTVVPGPPLTSALVAATPLDPAVVLLRRAARGLCASGMVQHVSFYEWLVMHNEVLTSATMSAAAAAEEEAVREWWDSASCTNAVDVVVDTQQKTGLVDGADVLPRVRVVGLPQAPLASPHATKVAFALLYGMRLVTTEYVLLHDLHHVPVSAVPSHVRGSATEGASWASSAANHTSVQGYVQQEVTLALQALSHNDFASLPYILIDQARASAAVSDAIHAYRLQVYATAEWRQPAREAVLQRQLVTYVKRVLAPASPQTTTPASASSGNASAEKEAAKSTGPPHDSPLTTTDDTPVGSVEDGLPVVSYGTASHFHCERAPLYNVRVPVPSWLRASPHHHHHPSTSPASSTATVAPPPLSTLCEVLLSRHSGMPTDYAGQGTVFYRSFCQEWLQFTLLPRPATVRTAAVDKDTPPENPLLEVGKVVGAAARRRIDNDVNEDVLAQKADMAQSLADGLCTVMWVAYLKASQLWYSEQAERRRGPRNVAASATTTKHELMMSNMAGASPYLDQYAALLFSDDVAELSRLAGTYLAYLPNVSYALTHLRRTVTDKLDGITLKYATERTRRFKSRKASTDREVVCVPSYLARVDTHATMYPTQWFLTQLVLRCLQHKERCLGSVGDTDARVTHNVARYFSTTGKWSRGEFQVCMSSGVYVSDPSTLLP